DRSGVGRGGTGPARRVRDRGGGDGDPAVTSRSVPTARRAGSAAMAAIEIGILVLLVQSYVWLWVGLIPRGIYVVSAAVLLLAIASIRIHGDGPREIGLRLDNIVPASKQALLLTAIPSIAILAVGIAAGAGRPPRPGPPG